MNNIPVFDTENGVGSLILKDVSYTQIAYVKIASVSNLKAYVDECVAFCRVVGAERIYATGHDGLTDFPYHTTIVAMECKRSKLDDTDAELVPVTEDTLMEWLRIYRNKMKNIQNAAYMSDADGKQMIRRGDGYFVYRNSILQGIGLAAGNTIDLVASVQPGGGHYIVHALSQILSGDVVILDVSAENEKAVQLYKCLGFTESAVKSKWYKIF